MNPNGDSLAPVIKESCMESCQYLEDSKILFSLKKMKKLKVLSVAWIAGVTNKFVSELLAYLGRGLKDISLFGYG